MEIWHGRDEDDQDTRVRVLGDRIVIDTLEFVGGDDQIIILKEPEAVGMAKAILRHYGVTRVPTQEE